MSLKLPVPMIVALIGAILLAVILIFRPQASPESLGSSSGLLTAQAVPHSVVTVPSSVQQTVHGDLKTRKLIADKNPKYWQLSQVAAINYDSFGRTIVFSDGSTKPVTDFLLSQVPGDIRVRLEYAGEN